MLKSKKTYRLFTLLIGAIFVCLGFAVVNLNGAWVNAKDSYGEAIYVGEGSTVTLGENSYFSGLKEEENGIIYVKGNLEIDGAVFENCSSSYGGAIYVDGGSVSITNATFINCSADMGGAIYVNDGSVSIENATFSGCSAEEGGAIYTNSSIMNIEGATFQDCSARLGDSIRVVGDTVSIYINDQAVTYKNSGEETYTHISTGGVTGVKDPYTESDLTICLNEIDKNGEVHQSIFEGGQDYLKQYLDDFEYNCGWFFDEDLTLAVDNYTYLSLLIEQNSGTVNLYTKSSIDDGLIYTYNEAEKYWEVSGDEITGKSTDGIIVIPMEYKGEPVGAIADYGFEKSENITSITLNNGLKSIGSGAFLGRSYNSINLPNTVEKIGDGAFGNVTSVGTKMSMPHNLKTIGNKAFNLSVFADQPLYIPCGVSSISECAFMGCDWIIGISVDIDNKTYDSRENCDAIIETNTNKLIQACGLTIIPNTVQIVDSYSFANVNYTIKNLVIPKSVEYINELAFIDSNIDVLYIYGDNIRDIYCSEEDWTLSPLLGSAIKEVYVGTDYISTSSKNWLFIDEETCIEPMYEMKIDLVPKNDVYVIFYVDGIRASNAIDVHEGTFDDIIAEYAPISDKDCCGWFFDPLLSRCVQYYEDILDDDYISLHQQSKNQIINLYTKTATLDVINIVDDTVRAYIGSGNEEVVIPRVSEDGEVIRYIGDSAFEETTISNIVFNNGLYTIESRACYETSIKQIIIPDTVSEIQTDAFFYCSEAKRIVLGDKLVSIGARAFFDCNQLSGELILSGVDEYLGHTSNIGDGAFDYAGGTEGLLNIYIPEKEGLKDNSLEFEYFYGKIYYEGATLPENWSVNEENLILNSKLENRTLVRFFVNNNSLDNGIFSDASIENLYPALGYDYEMYVNGSLNDVVLPISDEDCAGWFLDPMFYECVDYSVDLSTYGKVVNLYTKLATKEKLIFKANDDATSYSVTLDEDAYGMVVIPRKYNGLLVTQISDYGPETLYVTELYINNGMQIINPVGITVGVSYLVIPSTVTHIYDSFLAGGMNLQAIYIGNVDQVDQLALTIKLTPNNNFTVYVPFTILPKGWSDLWYDEDLPLYVSYGNTIWNLLKNTEVLSFLPIIDGGIDDFDKDFEIKESLNISFDLDILNEFKQDVIIKEEEEYQVLFDAPKTTN